MFGNVDEISRFNNICIMATAAVRPVLNTKIQLFNTDINYFYHFAFYTRLSRLPFVNGAVSVAAKNMNSCITLPTNVPSTKLTRVRYFCTAD